MSPGSASSELDAFTVGSHVLAQGLGRDALAEQWLAKQDGGERLARLIRLTPAVVADAEAVRAFVTELEALRGVEHPGLVRTLEVRQSDADVFALVELVEGITLRELLALAAGGLPPDVVLCLAADVAAALEALHDAELAHGDVCPETIFVLAGGVAMLAPSGLGVATCRAEDSAPSRRLAHKAPEQRAGRAATAQSDVYALAATLSEALAKPEAGVDVLARALERDPAARPEGPRVLLRELEAALGRRAAPRFEVARAVSDLAARDLAALRFEVELSSERSEAASAKPEPVVDDDWVEDTQPSLRRVRQAEEEQRSTSRRRLLGVVLVACSLLAGLGVVASTGAEPSRAEPAPAARAPEALPRVEPAAPAPADPVPQSEPEAPAPPPRAAAKPRAPAAPRAVPVRPAAAAEPEPSAAAAPAPPVDEPRPPRAAPSSYAAPADLHAIPSGI